jgi:hypothetical protein
MEQKQSSKSQTVSGKISKETLNKFVNYAKKINLPVSTLVSLSIINFINRLEVIENDQLPEIGKDLSSFCEMWFKSYSNYAMIDIKQALQKSPEEDRIMIELAIEKGGKLNGRKK